MAATASIAEGKDKANNVPTLADLKGDETDLASTLHTPSELPGSTFYTPLQSPMAAADKAPASGLPSPASAQESDTRQDDGGEPAPRRRSVQFDRSVDEAEGGSPSATTPTDGRPKQRLKSRMRSFGLATRPTIHRRTKSSLSTSDSPLDDPRVVSDGAYGDTDGEASGSEAFSPVTPDAGKRRRLQLRDWMPAPRGSQTEPNTPMDGHFSDEPSSPGDQLFKSRPRARLPIRRATMTDIPEDQRAGGVSEDEGRARMAAGSPGAARRRSTAWLQTAQSPSFIRRRNKQSEETEKSNRSGAGRRHRRMVSSPGADGGSSGWKQRASHLKAQIKAAMVASQRKRVERGADYIKSAELMAELLAGSPAAIILASHFQRDESLKRKVPVLLEQLKISIPWSERVDDSTDRHMRFRIDLEYGNGLMRMRWTIWRFLGDFMNLHFRYTGSNLANLRRKTASNASGKLPSFPKRAFPFLRKRGLAFADDDEDGENDESAIVESAPVTPRTPRRPLTGHARRISQHIRAGSNTGPAPETPGTGKKEDFAETQRKKLETYLREMIRHFTFQAGSNRLCKFLEISALGVNLAAEGGYHGKEGMLKLKTGTALKKTSDYRWYLVRQSYVVCVQSPEETVLSDVFLVDPDFQFDRKRGRMRDQKTAKDLKETAKDAARDPQHHRLRLANSERSLTLIARNERQQEQFADSIEYMMKNTEWATRHRFDSFAPVRRNVFAEWLVDGRDYMWKVSRAISMAENVIYIHDWWLSPELYMRRPPAISHKWRLDRLLQRKAQEGVKIYIIMYRNINSAIPIDSEYSKLSLLDLHPNIYVQRSPNQVRQNVFFWAHHEKICVVDHIVGFCGGVDLCFGRWDSPEHRVVDDKRTGHEPGDFPRDADHCQLWPGKDYSNPRVQDFFKLDEPYGEMYDRTKVPRMPWHDIGMQVVGQPARDLTRHFVQRWNFLLRQRTPRRPIPVLLPPPDFDPEDLESLGFSGTCDIQILRSASEWSLGTPGKVEHSIMNAYVKLIEQSDHFVYVENQFFISSCYVDSTQIHNLIGDALVERIIRAHDNQEDWMACIVIPLMPGFQNLVDETDGTSVRLIMQCQFRSMCRGETSIFGRLRAYGIEPTDYIQFYSLRQWGKIGPEKALTTEQLYIHAKCMIVDDRHVIIGSANINERSMLGSRDSEIASIVQDKDMIDGMMAGRPYKVGRFPHSLRMRLMREHLGIDVDSLRESEIEQFYQGEMDDESEHGSPATPDSGSDDETQVSGQLRPKKPSRLMRDLRPSAERARQASMDVQGRDSVILEGNREVLVNSKFSEGRGTLLAPKKSPNLRPTSPAHQPFDRPELPPALAPRMYTQELGLTLLSQLPPLPTTDDSDIGGPALQPQLSGSTLSDVQRANITDDCMKDPLDDGFFLKVWHRVAENNTKLFRQVFRCQPDNEVKDWATYHDYMEYARQFSAMQGVQHATAKRADAPTRTGPPGTETETVIKEKLDAKQAKLAEQTNSSSKGASGTTLSADASVTRLNTGGSMRSVKEDEALDEKSAAAANETHNHVGFGALPNKEGENGLEEKKATPAAAGNNSTRRRRRTNTKSGGMMRGTDRVLSKDEASELLNLTQGTLVVFPYDWLCKEEESSKWLYGVDQMAPLEIYD